MLLESACSCHCATYWSQVLSVEWRCSWSSADRRCSNYIWLINNLIGYKGASYITDLTVYQFLFQITNLTHCGWVTHICVSKLTIIGSDSDLLPCWCQAIIWNNAGIWLIQNLGTNFSEIWSEIHTFLLKKFIWKYYLQNHGNFVLAWMFLKEIFHKSQTYYSLNKMTKTFCDIFKCILLQISQRMTRLVHWHIDASLGLNASNRRGVNVVFHITAFPTAFVSFTARNSLLNGNSWLWNWHKVKLSRFTVHSTIRAPFIIPEPMLTYHH